ncbi:MAG: PQQ-binding-like beta-propeller repeat protein [Planctomycetes bacterium]|nr:PQQ-binding-like beta-propeller repeat protein [Planctomycetota bacterium]
MSDEERETGQAKAGEGADGTKPADALDRTATMGAPASPPTPRPTPPRGEAAGAPRIPGFEVLGEIGRGAMGIVYKARQAALDRTVAVKVLAAAGELAGDALERFRREARAAAALDHPAIVRTHEVGAWGGTHYIVQEYVEGPNLSHWLKEEAGPLTPRQAAEMLLPIAQAVAHAHSRGVVHRDLKPSNILVSAGDRPKLSDFGLALREGEERLSRSGRMVGTPAYMAPEQVEGDPDAVGPHTDVYGLGAVLYELLAGRIPFAATRLEAIIIAIETDDPPPPSRFNAKVGREIEAVCLKCLEKKPARRYSSAGALAADLAAFLAGEPVSARLPGVFARAARLARRHRWAAIAGTLFLASSLAVGWILAGPARLRIRTDPPDAEIAVDGETVGMGEVDLTVWPPGTRTLEARREGYVPVVWEVEMRAGTSHEETIELPARAGSIRVESDPPGAEIWLDGRPTGLSTGAELSGIREGTHVLALRLDGYAEEIADGVEVRHGEIARLARDLRVAGVRVRIEIAPAGSLGEILREEGGRARRAATFSTTFDGELPAGRYSLRIKGPDGPGELRWAAEEDAFEVRGEPVVRRYRLDEWWRPIWSFKTGAAIHSTPALADLDGDGVPDALFGSDDGRLYAVAGSTGREIWSYHTVTATTSSPALADLDGDGVPDALVGSLDRALHAVSGATGRALWTFETGGEIFSSPAIADLDGDRIPDAVFGSRDKRLHCVSGRTARAIWVHETGGEIAGSPALADLDGDGVPDAVVASNDGALHAVSGASGEELWSAPLGGEVWASPALADLDGDLVLDAVCGSNAGALQAVSGRSGKPIWSATLGERVSSPAVADLDGDHVPDAVAGVAAGKRFALAAVSGRTGTELWSASMNDEVGARPALLFLDRDETPDVLVGSADGILHARSGRDGSLLFSVPTGGPIYCDVALSDLDGDGWTDAIFGSNDGNLYAIGLRGTAVLWSHEIGGAWHGKLALFDSTVLAGSDDGRVHAISAVSGRTIWSREIPEEGSFRQQRVPQAPRGPAPGDLDGDGTPDLVAASASCIQALEMATGDVRWSYWTRQDPVDSDPALCDVDSDGGDDVVFATESGVLVALSGRTGKRLWHREMDDPIETGAAPLPAELDGAAGADLVLAISDGVLEARSGAKGKRLWIYEPEEVESWGEPVLADLDGDGTQDILAMGSGNGLHAVSGRSGKPLWVYRGSDVLLAPPALALLDGDKIADAVVAFGEELHAVSGSTGQRLWALATGGRIASEIRLADLDHDGVPDAVAASGESRARIFAASGKDGHELWSTPLGGWMGGALELALLDGDLVPDVAAATYAGTLVAASGRTGAVLWSEKAAPEATLVPADLSGDGRPELLVAAGPTILALAAGRRDPVFDPRLGLAGTAAAALLGSIPRAPEAADRFVADFPNHEGAARVFLERARRRRAAGDLAGAREDLAAASARGLASPELYHELLLVDPETPLPADSPRVAIALGMDFPPGARERIRKLAPTRFDPNAFPLSADALGAEGFTAYREGRLGEAIPFFRQYFAAIHRPAEGEGWIRRAELLAGLTPALPPHALHRHLRSHEESLSALDESDRRRLESLLARWREAHPGEEPPRLPW